jgi:hypothetical protein
MMLARRIALILAVSISAFVISLVLDLLLAPLPAILQFLIQVPILVILIEEGRRYALNNEKRLGLGEMEINGAFFFAAPLAAFAAFTLFKDINSLVSSRLARGDITAGGFMIKSLKR